MYRNQRTARQRGFGLPFAIFVLVILGLVGLAIAELEQTSAEGVVFDVQSTRAYLAAQSGAELGLNRLLPPLASQRDCTDGFFSAGPSVSFVDPGLEACAATVSCRVDVIGGQDYFTLTSRGVCGSGFERAERVIEVGVY